MKAENIKKSLETAIKALYNSFHTDMWIEFRRFNTSSLAAYLSSGHLKEGYINAFLEALKGLGIIQFKTDFYDTESFKIKSGVDLDHSNIIDCIIEAKKRDVYPTTEQNDSIFNVRDTAYILSGNKEILEVKVVEVKLNLENDEINYSVIDNSGCRYPAPSDYIFRSPEELTANLLNNVVKLNEKIV